MARRGSIPRCIAVALLVAGLAVLAAPAHAAKPNKEGVNNAAAATAEAAADAAKAASSECGKQCFAAAKKLGMQKVATDALSCFMTYKGAILGHNDCCDKAELLLGARGALANCFCCPEFAKAMLSAVPFAKMGVTPHEYLEKMNLCRVPIYDTPSCSPRRAKEAAYQAGGAAGAAAGAEPVPIMQIARFGGALGLVGFNPLFDPQTMAGQGAAAVKNDTIDLITVAGASDFYNQYVTGFIMYAEKETPRYNTPKLFKLPPLPEEFKEDVAWVANLRRGPYPEVVRGRPARFSIRTTDPLQNGKIASLAPAPAFNNRIPFLRSPVSLQSAAAPGGPTN